MNILPQQLNKFTDFLSYSIDYGKNITLNLIINALEARDKDIAAKRDTSRYSIIRIDPRTIITSIGKITFNRRYYYDNELDEYLHLLDVELDIPKHKRISNELEIKILKNLPNLSFTKAAKVSCDKSYIVSPATVGNILRRVDITPSYREFERSDKIFIQMDEKYINVFENKRKIPFYTATIFTNRLRLYSANKYQRNELSNRTILFAENQVKLFEKINNLLIKSYKLDKDTKVIISGDFAKYIRYAKEKINAENIRYIPDFFHVQQYSKKLLGEKLTNLVIGSIEEIEKRISQLRVMHKEEIENKYRRRKIFTLKSIMINYQNEMKYWFDDQYPGCSQEAINSHYASPRLAKLPMSISRKSLSKMLILMEADANNVDLIVDLKNKKVREYDMRDFNFINYIQKNYIDLSLYEHAYRNVLTKIMNH
jgi:hypothetical protein